MDLVRNCVMLDRERREKRKKIEDSFLLGKKPKIFKGREERSRLKRSQEGNKEAKEDTGEIS